MFSLESQPVAEQALLRKPIEVEVECSWVSAEMCTTLGNQV